MGYTVNPGVTNDGAAGGAFFNNGSNQPILQGAVDADVAAVAVAATVATDAAADALASAVAAAGSEANVAADALEASDSAVAAGVSETNAAASALASSNSASDSAASALASSNSASDSAASALASAGSASDSAASALASDGSASDSAASALASSNSASDSAASALAAGVSETNAAASALAASDSAADAAAEATLAVSAYAATLMGRNKIINGKLDVAQRGTSFAAIANGAYSLDRWQHLSSSGAAVTAAQVSDTPPDDRLQYSLRYTVTTADAAISSGDYVAVRQHIEGYNARDLIGTTFTLSFWVRSSVTGTHCVSFVNSGGDRSYIVEYIVDAANTWEYKTVAVTDGLLTAGTWDWTNGRGLTVAFALAAGTTFRTTANAWQVGNFLATANQVNCLQTVGNIFAVTGVQLEAGAATTFEHRHIQIEYLLCSRYFQTVEMSLAGYTAGGVTNRYYLQLPGPMRVTPVVSVSSATNVNTTGATISAVSATIVQHSSAGSAATGYISGALATLSAEL